jgi:hypothetical protein
MPVVDIAHQHMLTARAGFVSQTLLGKARFPTLDWSALIAGVRTSAGLDGLDSKKVRFMSWSILFIEYSFYST